MLEKKFTADTAMIVPPFVKRNIITLGQSAFTQHHVHVPHALVASFKFEYAMKSFKTSPALSTPDVGFESKNISALFRLQTTRTSSVKTIYTFRV